jgi:hypothetical protein
MAHLDYPDDVFEDIDWVCHDRLHEAAARQWLDDEILVDCHIEFERAFLAVDLALVVLKHGASGISRRCVTNHHIC